MSTQIAVRLPDAAVAFLDEQVSSGAVRSRADFIARAIRREQRRIVAERDIEILRASATQDDPDDLNAFAEWSARQPRPELD